MLPLFPERVLDTSIHTSILVALLVMWLLTETLGWPFVGFVVGGYLAAILITHVPAFIVICLEAILTYGLVWAVGYGAMRVRLSHHAFGRERFLLFVLFSVPVRLLIEGIAAPHLGAVLGSTFDAAALVSAEFYGIGLVLVPLFANTFWKVGLATGAMQMSVVTGATYALLSYVVVPFTNLHLGRFELTFESAALDFVTSPKLYVILLVTAIIAAHNSVRHGWDVGGILVPALLALTLMRPLKFAFTLVEVVALVFLYSLLRKVPGLRSLNMHGPRRLVGVYTLSYGLKYCITWLAQLLRTSAYVSDFFGFGYLLTSLLAVKCLTRRDIPRVLAPAVVTAAQGLVVGSLVAAFLAMTWVGVDSTPPTRPQAAERSEPTFAGVILSSQALVRLSEPGAGLWSSKPYVRLWSTLRRLANGEIQMHHASRASGVFGKRGDALAAGTVKHPDGRPCVWMRARRSTLEAPAGLPSFVWCGGDGPALVVSQPWTDPDALLIGTYLGERGQFSAVIVAGVDGEARTGTAKQRLRSQLRRALGKRPTIDVHSCERGTYAAPRGRAADLSALAAVLAPLQLVFLQDHGALQHIWEQLDSRSALLCVSNKDLDRLLPSVEIPVAGVETFVGKEDKIAHQGFGAISGPEVRMSFAQLLVRSALRWARDEPPHSPAPNRLAYLARHFGYRTRTLARKGERFWALQDVSGTGRGWGNLLIRPGGEQRLAILAPDGLGNDSASLARLVFERLQGEVLWTHSQGDGVRGPVVTSRRVPTTSGDVPVHRLLHRELLHPTHPTHPTIGDRRRLRAVIVRPMGVDLAAGAWDLLLSTRERLGPGAATAIARALHINDHVATKWLHGEVDDPVSRSDAQRYLQALDAGIAVTMWASPELLSELGDAVTKKQRLAFYRRLGVSVREGNPTAVLAHSPSVADAPWHPLLRRHVRQGLVGPLRALLASGAKVAAYDHGDGLTLIADKGAISCQEGLLSPLPRGCWSRRP